MATQLGNMHYVFRSKIVVITTGWKADGKLNNDPNVASRDNVTIPPTLASRSVKIAPPPGTILDPEGIINGLPGTLPIRLEIIGYENNGYTIKKVEVTDKNGIHDYGDLSTISVTRDNHNYELDYLVPCDTDENDIISVIWYLTQLSNRVNVFIKTHTDNDKANICEVNLCPGKLTTIAVPNIIFDIGDGEELEPQLP